ncbi:hypothetical protein [Pseudomonas sp. PNPG3]|uniref:hypothetical protein n=1 Tax=Pseudomonas sp. PNPG3 TaxID=2919497 RepID=UPI001FFCD8AE|nr:hypothetical protein [Pseudomonas sp. PNPG3]MCK2122106.1 hypothetical protein [Pseudomonas sp. PNPG3]
MNLTPLVKSAQADEVEAEFKQLFLRLYQQRVAPSVNAINLYGMPMLGETALLERYISSDGLAVLRTTTVDQVRHLFHAWRYNNPQRGTAFLKAYLNALFGPVYTVSQLWCPINGNYPADAISEEEMEDIGANKANYFLTSRLRVDIETQVVPERILRASLSAVAARFVLELRTAKRLSFNYKVAAPARMVITCRATGSTAR